MRPTRLFQAAGTLTDPPVSEPIDPEFKFKATLTAAPEEEPPGASLGSIALGGVFVIGLTPRPEKAYSLI